MKEVTARNDKQTLRLIALSCRNVAIAFRDHKIVLIAPSATGMVNCFLTVSNRFSPETTVF
jgi:hypothetical protein